MKQFQIENLVELLELQLLLLHSPDSDCAGSVSRQLYDAHGLHDTVVIPGHGKVIIRIPFGDYGKLIYHCHTMFHGDGGKMGVVQELNCIFVYRDHIPKNSLTINLLTNSFTCSKER
ncbi:MAG: multicopper oxidase domain-containing protein [Nitrososphaeraceae archaeon]|nr:multicopper oxidase domain-containing protein [Nitrososphaeraceae archaeon]